MRNEIMAKFSFTENTCGRLTRNHDTTWRGLISCCLQSMHHIIKLCVTHVLELFLRTCHAAQSVVHTNLLVVRQPWMTVNRFVFRGIQIGCSTCHCRLANHCLLGLLLLFLTWKYHFQIRIMMNNELYHSSCSLNNQIELNRPVACKQWYFDWFYN